MDGERAPTLTYLYGPPAVGKLTVATPLAEVTGHRLFHNHLSVNAVRPIFELALDTIRPGREDEHGRQRLRSNVAEGCSGDSGRLAGNAASELTRLRLRALVGRIDGVGHGPWRLLWRGAISTGRRHQTERGCDEYES
jgi:hypothetical protein